MLHACATRFDVTENLKKFWFFFKLNNTLVVSSVLFCLHLKWLCLHGPCVTRPCLVPKFLQMGIVVLLFRLYVTNIVQS